MRNDDSYEAYKRKFNLGVVGVIILMLVLWFGNFEHDNAHVKKFNDTICAGEYSEISEALKEISCHF